MLKNILQLLTFKFIHIHFIIKHIHLLFFESINQNDYSSLIRIFSFLHLLCFFTLKYLGTFINSRFYFNISNFLVRMGDNVVNLASDYECDTSFAARMGTFPDSYLPPLAHDCTDQKVIPLFNDSDSERAYGNSYEEWDSLFNSFKALFSNDNEDRNHTKAPMAPPVLTEEEIQAINHMREHADDFV